MDDHEVEESTSNLQTPGVKPHVCQTCEKTFKNLSLLKRHSKVHTGEKPYGCEVCGNRFSRLSVLKIHKRTHRGETI